MMVMFESITQLHRLSAQHRSVSVPGLDDLSSGVNQLRAHSVRYGRMDGIDIVTGLCWGMTRLEQETTSIARTLI